jgi:hypothetical protein
MQQMTEEMKNENIDTFL